MKTDGSRSFRTGTAAGVAIVVVLYFALGDKGWEVFRIAMLPPALGLFSAKFFPYLTLEPDAGKSGNKPSAG